MLASGFIQWSSGCTRMVLITVKDRNEANFIHAECTAVRKKLGFVPVVRLTLETVQVFSLTFGNFNKVWRESNGESTESGVYQKKRGTRICVQVKLERSSFRSGRPRIPDARGEMVNGHSCVPLQWEMILGQYGAEVRNCGFL